MELASVIQNGSRLLITSSSDRFLLNLAQFHIPKFTRLAFSSSLTSTSPLVAVRSRKVLKPFSTASSRRIANEDELSTSDDGLETSQSCSDVSDMEKFDSKAPLDIEQEENVASENYAAAVRTVAFYVSAAVAFGVGIGLKEGVEKATEFFAGYLLEQSLSVDNLFVFVLVFKFFKVPKMYQNRVLSYGIAGAIVFRLSLILLGTATLQRFEVVNILLAGILLFSAFKLFTSEEDDTDLSDNFIVKTCQKFIPVTDYYDGNRFFTVQDGIKKA